MLVSIPVEPLESIKVECVIVKFNSALIQAGIADTDSVDKVNHYSGFWVEKADRPEHPHDRGPSGRGYISGS